MDEATTRARGLVHELVHGLGHYTHDELAEACAQHRLPAPPPQGPPEDAPTARDRYKRERLQLVLDQLDAQQEPTYFDVLDAFITRGLPPAQRNAAEDLLWSTQAWPAISERVRRDVAGALDGVGFPRHNPQGLMAALRDLWVLEDDASLWSFGAHGPAAEVERHLLNNEDWTTLDLFAHLGALTASDRRFALFLEALLSYRVCPDEAHQRAMAEAFNPALARDGLKLEETGEAGGYPQFELLTTGSARRPPQLLLFASSGAKPDLRVDEVLDRRIEVMNPETVLRYEEPIGADGLKWSHLLAWWQRLPAQQERSPEEAKNSLWRRLLASLPKNSPPQRTLFELYYKLYGATARGEDFPALLPEVWVHWDHRTISQRGAKASPTHRMDFLMLLPGRVRVVLEVDGKQHYSDDNDRPSPERYAQTMRGGRRLQSAGYQVRRIGGYELIGDRALATVSEVFDGIFRQWLS